MSGNLKNKLNTYFSAGLGRGGQAAAWLLAFGVVGTWQYYETSRKNQVISDEERDIMNESTKEKGGKR